MIKFKTLLGMVMVLTFFAAGTVMWERFIHAPTPRGLVGRPLLPTRHLSKVGIVVMQSASGQVTLRRGPDGWTVDETDGKPADENKLLRFLRHLTTLRIAERIPVRSERLSDFGLLRKVENEWRFEHPKTAKVLSLSYGLESSHKLLFRVLIGKQHALPGAGGGVGTYVRFPSTHNVYLVGAPLSLDTDPEVWTAPSMP